MSLNLKRNHIKGQSDLASGNKQGNDRLGRENNRLDINKNIGTAEGFPFNELNTRRLRRTIPVSPSIISPKTSSVPLDKIYRLTGDEESDIGFMTLTSA